MDWTVRITGTNPLLVELLADPDDPTKGQVSCEFLLLPVIDAKLKPI